MHSSVRVLSFRAVPVGLALVAATGCSPMSAGPGRNVAYVAPASHGWTEEFGGSELLEESGSLGSIVAFGYRRENGAMQGSIEVYGGEVDYDGQTQGGAPLRTSVDYVGFRTELNLAIGGDRALGGLGPDPGADSTLTPYVGLGLDVWSRDLRGPGGYVEEWLSLYAHVGVDVGKRLAGGSGLYASGSVGYSLINAEQADLSAYGFGEVDLDPGPGPVLQARAGWTKGALFAGLFARLREFAESDPDNSGFFLQPESHQQVVGLELGLAF